MCRCSAVQRAGTKTNQYGGISAAGPGVLAKYIHVAGVVKCGAVQRAGTETNEYGDFSASGDPAVTRRL